MGLEEEPKFLVDEGNGGDDEVYEDELFYENIEAPKFVDLAAPERYLPVNDRYWFCSRVGCDQKHEEEMDSEEIYKRFVLRVMAARSPNVRLRKALYRTDSSSNLKCPKTVPPKPRVSRLALISSISKRLVEPKIKAKHPSRNIVGTPNPKLKQSTVPKALTTPRNKKQLSNLDAFRSVRNLKGMSIAVGNNNTVVKALVFGSPRKAVKGKKATAMELKTPVKDLCTTMKKLEIGSVKKPVLGCNRPPPSDAKRTLLRVREVKSRVYDGLSLHHRVKNDSSVNEIAKKSNDDEASLLDSSRSGSNNWATPQDDKADDNTTVRGGAEDIKASSLEKESNDGTKKDLSLDDKDESDDKENKSTSGNKNSGFEDYSSNIEDKALGKLHNRKENPKVQSAKLRGTLPKKTYATTTTIPEELRQRKPKPTNPKPFRLRTDERRILKEAIVEKKLPEKITTSATPDRHQTKLLQDEASHLQVLREKVGRTLSTTPQRHTVSSQQKLVAPKIGNSSTNGRSQAVKRLARPRAKADTEETPSISSKPLLKSKSHRINNSREPNFHSLHTPKSCTRKLA